MLKRLYRASSSAKERGRSVSTFHGASAAKRRLSSRNNAATGQHQHCEQETDARQARWPESAGHCAPRSHSLPGPIRTEQRDRSSDRRGFGSIRRSASIAAKSSSPSRKQLSQRRGTSGKAKPKRRSRRLLECARAICPAREDDCAAGLAVWLRAMPSASARLGCVTQMDAKGAHDADELDAALKQCRILRQRAQIVLRRTGLQEQTQSAIGETERCPQLIDRDGFDKSDNLQFDDPQCAPHSRSRQRSPKLTTSIVRHADQSAVFAPRTCRL